jgi:hypothetical protein
LFWAFKALILNKYMQAMEVSIFIGVKFLAKVGSLHASALT